ncbi:ABC transporter ATP-binding protein [Protaetiibacter sp. SSC-01]|uniref:energy-coupling factor ABC transporter ATP-binding protein n=1 Tax=Protaetiibacter sp. SSC-01 TaxID=2759943 RepID=UPI001656FC44|nr:ABC transporter ATP-binding protein [Protaetiibacter sp. SSC-01]QNO36318.1 ABC transporter ATP-binding protein [Protaetiibacter sp. SSC-01]
MSDAAHAIELEAVTVDLDGRRILEDVDVRLDARRIAVVGANGSGKSTFARLLNGLVRPMSGTVRVHGVDVAREPKRARASVGFVFTNPDAQLLMPTVAEDVRLSLRGAGLTRAEIDERVAIVLDAYGLADHAETPVFSLSGGQKQLLALASVLVREPRLVVADEPTTLLDLGNARRIGRILLDDLDAQLVVVTHDLELAERCDIALRFDRGRLVEVGEPTEVVGAYRKEFA